MSEQHFVYVYRDLDGNPIYFGQGFGVGRAADHIAGPANQAFAQWLSENPKKYRLEIMGPLGSKIMADAVETALISACMPAKALALTNQQPGVTKYTFRSYGVPDDYSHRIANPLGMKELKDLIQKDGPVMFVRIKTGDHEYPIDPADPPTNEVIRNRICAWWQLGTRIKTWTNNQAASPALLVGVLSLGRSQIILGSCSINRAGWSEAVLRSPGKLFKVPLINDHGVDAAGLRGRPIEPEVDLKFGQGRAEHFRIFQ